MDTSIHVARGMTREQKGRSPRGAIGDTDSRSTSGPDPAAEDIRIVTAGHGFIGGCRVLASGHCGESGIVDQNDQCGKCHITRRACIQKGNSQGSFLKRRHCYDPDILCHRIGPEVP